MKIYVSPVSGWQSGVLGFDSLHPLQSNCGTSKHFRNHLHLQEAIAEKIP